jgi:hypothetical protein
MAAPTPQSVRFFPSDHPALTNTARARIEAEKRIQLDSLLLASNWDDYNKRVGKIRGLEEALSLLDQVEVELTEGNR